MVQTVKALLFEGSEKNVLNYSRFKEDFGPSTEDTEPRGDKLSRPEDFMATFTGDTNEDFKIGMKVTKSSLKVNCTSPRYHRRKSSFLCCPCMDLLLEIVTCIHINIYLLLLI